VPILLWIAACAGAEAPDRTTEELRLIELMEMRRTGDPEGIEGVFHPTAVYDDFTSGTQHRELPEITAFIRGWHSPDGATFVDVVQYHAGDGVAVAEWVLEGTRSGPARDDPDSLVLRRFRVDGLTLVEVEDGLIVRAADYADPTSLLLAEGAVVVLPEGDTLEAVTEPVTGG
jgi:hypothetical protein